MKAELILKVREVLAEISHDERKTNKEMMRQVNFLKRFLGDWSSDEWVRGDILKKSSILISREVI